MTNLRAGHLASSVVLDFLVFSIISVGFFSCLSLHIGSVAFFLWVSDVDMTFKPQAYHTVIVGSHTPIRRTLLRLLASGTIRICMPTNHRHFTARCVAAASNQPWSNRGSRRLPVEVGPSILSEPDSDSIATDCAPGKGGIAIGSSTCFSFSFLFLSSSCCAVWSGADSFFVCFCPGHRRVSFVPFFLLRSCHSASTASSTHRHISNLRTALETISNLTVFKVVSFRSFFRAFVGLEV